MVERLEPRWTVELYETSTGRVPVQKYQRKLRREPKILRAIDNEIQRLLLFGFQQGRDYPKPVAGWSPLWEVRAKKARILAYERPERVIVLLHGFTKDYGGKIRRAELETAKQRLKEWEGRMT